MASHVLAQSALAPRLAIHSTPEVNDLIASSVRLPDLSTLLAPFSESVEKVTLRNHNFETNTVASRFPLRFDEASKVRDVGPWETQGGWLDQVGSEIQERVPVWLKELSRPSATPWFAHFAHQLVNLRPVVPHDSLSQPIVYLIVTSAKHPEPLNAVADLYASTSPASLEAERPYMEPNILRYYVVLHDCQSETVSRSDSLALLDQVKKAYGIHCALLDIHSWNPEAPPPLEGPPDTRPPSFDTLWTPYLAQHTSSADVKMGEKDAYHIRVFLRELVVKSLIPWMERSVQSWNETLAASRRGITGRLFSVGRRFLGSGSGSAKDPNNPHAFNQSKRWYPHQATEAQTRKLADFAFVLRDYQLAASMYELARKEFQSDRAWLDFAHATRMLGLSQLLQLTIKPNPSRSLDADALLDQAYNATLALSGPPAALAQLEDIKALCLYVDASKHLGRLRSVPQMLVRSAGDIEEVSAALLLEQAAVMDLNIRPTAFARKAGFHFCMAAIRYEKIGLKPLAQHCLTQASEIYTQDLSSRDPDKPFDVAQYAQLSWPLIDSYIHQALGRQAYHLGQAEEALNHFLALLAHAAGEESEEGDQGAWADLKLAHESLGERAGEALKDRKSFFKDPIFEPATSHIVFKSDQAVSLQGSSGAKPDLEALENLMLATGFRDVPSKAPTAFNQGRSGNIAAVSETFHVSLQAKNPMNAWLILTDIQLTIDAEDSAAVEVERIAKVDVEPLESAELIFAITCSRELILTVQGISFTVNGVLHCQESLQRQGRRLQATREQRLTPTYAQDLSLQVTVKQPVPKLEVDAHALPETLLAGETTTASIIVKNCTKEPIADLRLLSSHPHFLLPLVEASDPYASNQLHQHTSFSTSASIQQSSAISVPWSEDASEVQIPFLCRGDSVGRRSVHLLFAFASKRTPEVYLTTARTSTIKTRSSLDIRSSVRSVDSPSAPYAVSIELDNSHLNESVQIDSITSIGPAWRLRADRPLPKSCIVPRHQTASFGWQLEQVPADSSTCQPHWTCQQLEKMLQGDNIRDTLPDNDQLQQTCLSCSEQIPSLSGTGLQRIWTASRGSLRRAGLRSQFPSIDKGLHPHLFRLFTQRSLDVIIFWSIPERQIKGHHLIADLQIGPAHDSVSELLNRASGIAGGIYAESQRERALLLSNFRQSEYAQSEMPLVVALDLPSRVNMSHGRRSCRAQAKFTLKNISLLTPCHWSLTLQDPQDSPLFGHWSGRMRFSGSLSPGEDSQCAVMLAFSHPGLCQTGDWVIEVHDRGSHTWSLQGSGQVVAVQPAICEV